MIDCHDPEGGTDDADFLPDKILNGLLILFTQDKNDEVIVPAIMDELGFSLYDARNFAFFASGFL